MQATRINATIIALSNLNRDNYSTSIGFDAFKETGEIQNENTNQMFSTSAIPSSTPIIHSVFTILKQ